MKIRQEESHIQPRVEPSEPVREDNGWFKPCLRKLNPMVRISVPNELSAEVRGLRNMLIDHDETTCLSRLIDYSPVFKNHARAFRESS